MNGASARNAPEPETPAGSARERPLTGAPGPSRPRDAQHSAPGAAPAVQPVPVAAEVSRSARARRWRRLDLVERHSRISFVAAALMGARDIAKPLDPELYQALAEPFFVALRLRDRISAELQRLHKPPR